MPRKLTQEEFIEKCIEKHGDTYDYSKALYKGLLTKVCIICHEKDDNGKEHGEFWQNPQAHYLRGDGCPICRYIKSKKSLRESVGLTKETFIERAIKVHGNKYDYSNVVYENTDTKVKIICPEHGEFWQTPHHHLRGSGCQQCCKHDVSEKKITNIIKEHFENVVTQYKPDFLIGYEGKRQSLDIFLPDYNIAIEYQGRQHFSPQERFGRRKRI